MIWAASMEKSSYFSRFGCEILQNKMANQKISGVKSGVLPKH